MTDNEKTYSYAQISKAVNDGRDLVYDALVLGDRDSDLLNLVVNAALSLLDNPDMDFEAVVISCYDATPEEVREWWSW
jgi:hypothetical protein